MGTGMPRHVHRAPDSPTILHAPPARRAEIQPLAPARYSLHVTISEETYGKLRQASDLLRPTLPDGDPAAVIDRALTLLVAHLQRVKFGAKTPRPPAPERQEPPARPARKPRQRVLRPEPAPPTQGQPLGETPPPPSTPSSTPASTRKPSASGTRSRYIPAAVRRAVWQRDGGACAFVAPNGKRCGETGGLEFHHKRPFADGGEGTHANLELRCTTHNRREASRWYGDEVTTYRGRNDGRTRETREPDQDTGCRKTVNVVKVRASGSHRMALWAFASSGADEPLTARE